MSQTYFPLPVTFKQPRTSAEVVAEGQRNVTTQVFRKEFSGLTAFQRHKKMMTDYVAYYQSQVSNQPQKVEKSDVDILKEQHRFLREDEDESSETTWEARVAKKYYDKLFKEYCVANLSRYKTSQIALRWRTQKEVVAGKGQFICANLSCDENPNLRSWEVNFAYVEARERKNALVKLRLCPRCSYKLNYKKIKELRREEKEEKRKRKEVRRARRAKRLKMDDQGTVAGDGAEQNTDTHLEEEGEDSAGTDDEEQEEVDDEPDESVADAEVAQLWAAKNGSAPPDGQRSPTDSSSIDAFFADLFQ
ncbi:folate-sensitive fragile site protein Fra10Ac1-domain-containing protein [Fimicolochytrium jonesii]|uniref:folate-sensitive fragile site protein Fra10Ac1-domain-containing protein n=1 Tax=Fimicolochytrium jonesii TaxID=1396493 RepID=UPI0022FE945D|nr:folate-sensitive fragile site protein Fra10Ac1-domain-containing protein [Fimicolochytrium jonesii]KAI8826663.1 folate-sensitive fragile site protein Fra10Ac1-domain-containing protein [Fimicolochytrium jonesii]